MIVAPACLAFDGVTVVAHDHRLERRSPRPKRGCGGRRRPRRGAPADARLYRGIGLDPTKTRPSSEALLRRVRRGDTLPRVNTIVDLCNWCSVETQLAFGVYDRDRLVGDA